MELKSCLRDPATRKCAPPGQTLQRIEEGLRRLGLDFSYHGIRASKRAELYWGNLTLPSLNFSVEGKGCTEQLARASAFAEMAERLSSGQAVKPDFLQGFDYAGSFPRLHGYASFDFMAGYRPSRQEQLPRPVTVERLLERHPAVTPELVDKVKDSDVGFHWVEGYSITRDERVQVPLKLVHRISRSNGLAAGNTLEEAVVQASLEVLERFAAVQAVRRRLTLPTVALESVEHPQVRELAEFFAGNGIQVTVKDFGPALRAGGEPAAGGAGGFDGLEGRLPCYGLLMRNAGMEGDRNPVKRAFRTRTFRVASSFWPPEALLRCFTERMQGKTDRLLRNEEYFDLLWNGFLNRRCPDYRPEVFLYNIFRKYEYAGDLDFLEEGEEISLPGEEPPLDCLEEIRLLDRISRALGSELVVVDHTHPVIGFPVVRVVMPGVSDVLSYTRPDGQNDLEETIIGPSRAERDYLVPDLGYLHDESWMRDRSRLERIAGSLAEYIRAYNTHVLHTFGLYNREVGAFRLLATVCLLLEDLEGFQYCLQVLESFYPDRKREYKKLRLLAVTGRREKLRRAIIESGACDPCLLYEPPKNPLVSWRESPEDGRAAQEYLRDLRKLVDSFYATGNS
ncbi:MAG: YcaO-like family protein [Spirochaetota bacterium]